MLTPVESFAELGLSEGLLKTLSEIGYETPSPIQAECIPVLLDGRDLIGQAQTGTGKTAAFALPLMEQIDVKFDQTAGAGADADARTGDPGRRGAAKLRPQSARLPCAADLRRPELHPSSCKQLARGAHIIVGTPGRVMDHLRAQDAQPRPALPKHHVCFHCRPRWLSGIGIPEIVLRSDPEAAAVVTGLRRQESPPPFLTRGKFAASFRPVPLSRIKTVCCR